jgi:DNA-binding response OmpR family regulator
MIMVTDQGSGIPEEFKAKIFQKFAQADSSSTRQKGGTGLGLNISKALIEKMGGSISFSSRPGHTVFTVTLKNQPAISQISITKNIFQSTAKVQKKLLICEDDADIRSLLKLILENEGFICESAATVKEAKGWLERERFDAITLDLDLPDEHGLSFIKELRQQVQTGGLPIIVISASADESKAAFKAGAVGVLDWLQKPIDTVRLKDVLSTLKSNAITLPRVLHIEDDLDIANVISLSLSSSAEIVHVATLAEARKVLQSQRFDLAILDLVVPDGNTMEILPALTERTHPIPVIILSALETPPEIQKQVSASLIKSVVSEEKIIHIIQSLIGERVE